MEKNINAGPIGDERQLSQYIDMLGKEKIIELLVVAPASLAERMDQLQAGIIAADSDMVREAAHAIKGTSGSLCAVRLAKEAAELEQSATDLDHVGRQLEDFQITAADTIKWWAEQKDKISSG